MTGGPRQEWHHFHELDHAHWAVPSKGASLIQTAELGGPGWQQAGPVQPVDAHHP